MQSATHTQPHLSISQNFDKHPLVQRSFFTKRVSVYTAAALATILVSKLKAPKHVTVILSIIAVAGLAILKLVPMAILRTSNTFILRKEILSQAGKGALDTNTSLKLSDGILLRGVFIKNKKILSTNNADRRIIFHLHGNGALANANAQQPLLDAINALIEDDKEEQKDMVEREFPLFTLFNESDVIDFNYRGTGNSEGETPTHAQLVKDGVEIVQALMDQGYRRENITLFGHSLGGSIAPTVTKMINEQRVSGEPAMRVIAYHTFHSLDEYISCRAPFLLRFPLKVITKIALSLVGWRYNFSAQDWQSIGGDDNWAIDGDFLDHIIPAPIQLASNLGQIRGALEGISGHNSMNDLEEINNERNTIFQREWTTIQQEWEEA
ncbi:MAG: hypothetical protein SP4CHLAM5_09620 [Chlamydiia bacterium]|nr:hypothetical protein [Chlamydiia bacterium]MCH9618820.1 hypothetical protein [Chlamydiia bacterium]MCH9624667.1 hypothetical protein [Chlamydiia bacterium]